MTQEMKQTFLTHWGYTRLSMLCEKYGISEEGKKGLIAEIEAMDDEGAGERGSWIWKSSPRAHPTRDDLSSWNCGLKTITTYP